jgi:dinuclear metal center YbgI/SA1388 family protein
MQSMKIKDLCQWLETVAPLAYQESYDNSGLLAGDAAQELTGTLVCLDSTEDVIDEAIRLNCNLVVAHHPILFSGLKKITGRSYIERTLIKAIKNDICIYAIHTNLDNVITGVNARICEKLGLKQLSILAPKKQLLRKLVTFVPVENARKLRDALFEAGAGRIGEYDRCSYNGEGVGTFSASQKANPAVGKRGEEHSEKESRIELIYPAAVEQQLLVALRKAHPYEEPAFDIYTLENEFSQVGSGMKGILEKPMEETEFLRMLKTTLKTGCVRHTRLLGRKVSKVAVCGGSGSFLLNDAIASGADVFVTSDYKYHQFFDADGKIVIADVGHFESEQFTKELLFDVIREKFPTFAIHLSETNTNPVNYL